MSMSLRASAWRVGLVVLFGGGLAAGVTAASSAGTPPAPPPAVDHQLCYGASGAAFKIPAGVRLENQFSPNGFVPRINPKVVLHCNPVAKALPSGKVFKITNPAAHLACFPITAAKQPTPSTVVVTNQFGMATLAPGQPNRLCVPSWKSLTGPPKKTPNTPPGLSHFTCYPVKVVHGAYKPPQVMLKDEVARKPVGAKVNPVPAELCLPTEKIVGKQVFGMVNPTMHLLFFPVTGTPIVPKVWDENQFGTAAVTIQATKWLAVPSIKRIG